MSDPKLAATSYAMKGDTWDAIRLANMVTNSLNYQSSHLKQALAHPDRFSLNHIYTQFLRNAGAPGYGDQYQAGDAVSTEGGTGESEKKSEKEGFSAKSLGKLVRNIGIGALWDSTVGGLIQTLANFPAHPVRGLLALGSTAGLIGLIMLTGGPTGSVAVTLAAVMFAAGGLGTIKNLWQIISRYSQGRAAEAEQAGRGLGASFFNMATSLLPFKCFTQETEAADAFKISNLFRPTRWPRMATEMTEVLTGRVQNKWGKTLYEEIRLDTPNINARNLENTQGIDNHAIYSDNDLEALRQHYQRLSFGDAPLYENGIQRPEHRIDVFRDDSRPYGPPGNQAALREIDRLMDGYRREGSMRSREILDQLEKHRDEVRRISTFLQRQGRVDSALAAYRNDPACRRNRYCPAFSYVREVQPQIDSLRRLRQDRGLSPRDAREIDQAIQMMQRLQRQLNRNLAEKAQGFGRAFLDIVRRPFDRQTPPAVSPLPSEELRSLYPNNKSAWGVYGPIFGFTSLDNKALSALTPLFGASEEEKPSGEE